ncbi:unnamed protein product (macronuclear) [Paramecium tetraurelia]|uniref:B box-type domain-containing protein n=1 Tax=Paramecium tetraurelia TaxID=5888 RepID=A0CLS7_PARTE|nr:uncharacterized protein GSPATT00038669001 [Paramecium tetraurelia]CAK71744.1 unnamed protein product [Paramecium tetraurelia]|eukprot:XP_001439141.1 hypothetical protein (macronuclear) [Paramecium tetraurelia strain d4-2]
MNCTYHIDSSVLLVCTAPHQCQFQRRLCVECQYEHGENFKNHTVPTKIFQQKVLKKLKESLLNETSQITTQRLNFKQMLALTQSKLKQIWEELENSIKLIYDQLEREENCFKNFNNVNPLELSNTELEKLVQIITGKPLDDWNDQKNSILKRLEMTKNYWNQETEAFCGKLNKEMKEMLELIKKDNSPQHNFQNFKKGRFVLGLNLIQNL